MTPRRADFARLRTRVRGGGPCPLIERGLLATHAIEQQLYILIQQHPCAERCIRGLTESLNRSHHDS